jgi:uncharacterized protein YlxP (DUF503 family)
MYFAVMKLTFAATMDSEKDRKDLKALAEKLRARFKICCAPCGVEEGGVASLAITALSGSENQLSHTLDEIAIFCETSGFGRIESESTLLDDIQSIVELADEAEAEDDEEAPR